MTLRKICSLTSVSFVTWLVACGSDFVGEEPGGGSVGRAGGGGNGTGGVAGSNGGVGGKSGTAGTTGTTGGQTGSAGAHPGMAGAGGAPSTPSCRTGVLANVLFCDDFEDPTLPGWSHLEASGDDGKTEYVSEPEPLHHGTGAVKSIKTSPGLLDPLVIDALGERTGDRLFTRVWMFIPGSVTITNVAGANASLLVLGEAPPSDGGVSIAMWPAGVSIQIYDPNSGVPLVQTAAFETSLPRDVWFCARLDFPIGESVSSSDFKLRIDDAVLTNTVPAKTVDSTLSGPYERLYVGVNYIPPEQASAVTVYYDDIAVDTMDIPCQ